MIPDDAPGSRSVPRGVGVVLPLAAAGVGILRGLGSPMTSDVGFHLVRAGNSLLRLSLDAWTVPPGGTHAPPLGALASALGAALTADPERKLALAGAVLLGVVAAWIVRVLLRAGGLPVALLGVSFLLLPPGLAASFPHRPDAALGGLLLAIALERARRGSRAPRATWPAWLAILATPWALPAAIALHVSPGLPDRFSPRALAAPAAVVAALAGAAAALPPGHRGEAIRYLVEAARPGTGGWLSAADALRSAWAGGLLLLPLAAAFGRGPGRQPARSIVPFVVALGAAFGLAAPGEFLGATALFAPAASLLLARTAAGIAPRSAAGPRLLVLAFLLPLLALLLGLGDTERQRRELRAAAVRGAQLGVLLWRQGDAGATAAAEATGALAALSGRPVHPLRADGALPDPRPDWVVFAQGRAPSTRREIAAFESPGFLAAYAPRTVRRGETGAVRDTVWALRPVPLSPAGPGYAHALRTAWQAGIAGDDARAEQALVDAVRAGPDGPGFAHEALGVRRERQGDATRSLELLAEARARDPGSLVARAHLADRALSAGDTAGADTLLAEISAREPEWVLLHALRARRLAAAGRADAAERESAAAADAAATVAPPAEGRILVNHGILLWRRGAHAEARAVWTRAVAADPGQRAYLGRFESAADSLPAPPVRAVLTDIGFDPGPAPVASKR